MLLRKLKNTDKIKSKVLTMVHDRAWTSLAWKILGLFVILFFGALIIFPFFFMFLTALMPISQVFRTAEPVGLIPHSFSWKNFADTFTSGYWAALLNTLTVTTFSMVFQITIAVLMGYALAYKKWRFKKAFWYLSLVIMMIPQIGLITGQYRVIINFKWQTGFKSIFAMVFPFAASIFSAYMFRNAFEAIPQRTKEAALIDGVGDMKYLLKIALPIVSPTIWTAAILTAFSSWNSYMWPALLAAGTNDFKTVLGLWVFNTGQYQDSEGINHTLMNLRMAASILAMLPLWIVYFSFRKRIMDAVAKRGSAIKG